MKTFDELSKAEQERAVEQELNRLLQAFCEGAFRFPESSKEAALFDEAVDEMDRMHTPWFIGEAVMERLGDVLRTMAESDAALCWYAELDDPYVVQRGVFVEVP